MEGTRPEVAGTEAAAPKPKLPPLPPPPPGVSRPTVLLLYIALIIIGVPVWWRTTEVYRAAIPFHLLDTVSAHLCIYDVA